jgi:hypothetical protein
MKILERPCPVRATNRCVPARRPRRSGKPEAILMANQKNQKEYKKEKTIERLFEDAKTGKLSPEFSDWSLADKKGKTIAHEAAMYRNLPADIDRDIYKLADKYGKTVAHEAAWRKHLPPEFERPDYEQWGMVDGEGQTVAHVAAAIYSYSSGTTIAKSARQWIKESRTKTPEDEESGPRP